MYNTPPQITTNITFTPDQTYENDVFTPIFSSVGADGYPITFTYAWYEIGQGSQGSNTLFDLSVATPEINGSLWEPQI